MQKKERNEELEYIDDFENIEEPEEPEDNREELEEPEEEYSEGGRRRKKGRKSDAKNAASVAGEFLSWVITIVAAVLIAMFLNRFVLINAEIPSGSMENTIMTGDKLIGFRWSYLFSGLPPKAAERADGSAQVMAALITHMPAAPASRTAAALAGSIPPMA